jgi:hypothetical protein
LDGLKVIHDFYQRDKHTMVTVVIQLLAGPGFDWAAIYFDFGAR